MPDKSEYANESGFDDQPINTLSSTVQKCINNVIEKEGFKVFDVKVENIATNGENYLGLLQTVEIKGKTANGDKEINLFIKNKTNGNDEFNFFPVTELYYLESYVYSELFGIYDKLQDEYKIPEEERYNIVKSYNEVNSEVIILENLFKAGFETANRGEVISLKFAELAITQMARLHGLSFVLQNKQPEYFEKKIKSLKFVNKFTPAFDVLMKKIFDVAVDSLEGQAQTKFKNFYPLFKEKFNQYFECPVEEAVCLCHGDFRANNMMLKKVEGEISKVYPIDYQFVNYNTPVLDFLYFIYGGSDQEFRNKYFQYLKDYYYESLEKFLELFGLKVADFHTKNLFEKEITKNMDWGLITFVMLSPFIFAVDEDLPDMSDKEFSFTVGGEYKKRLRENVEYFIQEGYL